VLCSVLLPPLSPCSLVQASPDAAANRVALMARLLLLEAP